VLRTEMDQLTERARRALAVRSRSVADTNPDSRSALAAIRHRLEVAGWNPRHADWAVTCWLLRHQDRSVEECLDHTSEAGSA
jgi:hypothetical protein